MSDPRSYYGRPVLKEPVWTWEIPAYFFTGGLARASSDLSLSAKLFGNEKLSKTALYIGAVADVASPTATCTRLGSEASSLVPAPKPLARSRIGGSGP